jgi:hypothetical protein
MKFGKCERCSALERLEPVGTIDPEKGPVVMQLCRQCSKLYMHVNRAQRRALTKMVTRKPKIPKKRADNATLMYIRKKAQEKKPSQIIVPEEHPIAPETPKSPLILPKSPNEKGGLILP